MNVQRITYIIEIIKIIDKVSIKFYIVLNGIFPELLSGSQQRLITKFPNHSDFHTTQDPRVETVY